MPRKKETITLSIPSGTKAKLEELARRLGIFWGKSPSISGLLVAIAQQPSELRKLFSLTPEQVTALRQAFRILLDTGHTGETQALLNLLLDHGNLEPPLRQSLTHLLNQPTEVWRSRVDELCEQKQPFKLTYTSPQTESLTYTVRYGEISFEEKRFYLNIWCEETEDISKPHFPELIHNHCLRLDRINSLEPTPGQWHHEGLDYLKVYLHFLGGMVKAYEAKPNDISSEVFGDMRQVVRRVSNPFWLIREVLRYGDECVIVSPENVRDRLKQKLLSLNKLYNV